MWAAAVLLVLLMFSSYALRSWSPRVASLALMGAITVYITGAGYITLGRIGWFVLALVVGFGWLALWEAVILPDRSAAVTRLVGAGVLPACRGHRLRHCRRVEHGRGRHVVRPTPERQCGGTSTGRGACRSAIERQSPGAVVRGFSRNDADRLRVALHSAQKGTGGHGRSVPTLRTGCGRCLARSPASISSTLHAPCRRAAR